MRSKVRGKFTYLKLQQLHLWGWKWMSFYFTYYNKCDYLTMLRLKSIHVGKRGLRCGTVENDYFVTLHYVAASLPTPIERASGTGPRAGRPLATTIVKQQFPSLSGITCCNNGGGVWRGSRFVHYVRLSAWWQYSLASKEMSVYLANAWP